MKLLRGLVILSVISCVCALLFVPTTARAADVNNFKILTYSLDYYLGRDAERRSTLKTVEKIMAEFPLYNQNHGIERAIPKSYDGHSTSLKILSVTDAAGQKLQYTTYVSNGNEVLRIGDADKFVHGLQTYVITYTQRDVTRYFSNTRSDEFYWDTNGTQWAVPIGLLSARVHFENRLHDKHNGNQRCYVGQAGSKKFCEITAKDNAYVISASALEPFENVTLAFGFPAQTFAPHKTTVLERLATIWPIVQAAATPLAFVLGAWFFIRYYLRSNRISERTTIVPEYLPPKDTSVATASEIYLHSRNAFAAQLIDFAVRHYTKIYQTREKSWFRPARYELEIIKDISDLKDEEQEIFRDIFPATAVGSRLALEDLRKNASATRLKLSDNSSKLTKSIKGAYGLRHKVPAETAWFKRAGFIVLGLSALLVSPALFVVAIVTFIIGYSLWPLTDKGLALYHHLEGLKMYIKIAEADQLRVLQSPEGAAKLDAPIDTNNKRQLVKLYERVLPYAMLFGIEKQWQQQLGRYYEAINKSPDWYSGSGNASLSAASFSSAMHNFSSVATYTSGTSSSSGGSSGGGSSGGGGGGGGGGGW